MLVVLRFLYYKLEPDTQAAHFLTSNYEQDTFSTGRPVTKIWRSSLGQLVVYIKFMSIYYHIYDPLSEKLVRLKHFRRIKDLNLRVPFHSLAKGPQIPLSDLTISDIVVRI